MVSLLSLLLLAPALVSATDLKLHVHNESFLPDEILRITAGPLSVGCYTRYSVLVNGTSPGPELRFRESGTKWIRVYNDMADQNLTMHWHGISQAAFPFSDGTPKASQWPIPPASFFDYELQFQADQAGTYFYHSHVGFQAVSATGPLIIEDRVLDGIRPYFYNDEKTIFLTDYFIKTDAQVEAGLKGNPFAWSGETNAVLVNGMGIGDAAAAAVAGPLSNTSTCGLETITVQPRLSDSDPRQYRFRFIGGTALSFVSLGFEGHNMSIIEADAAYTNPLETSFLQIGSGQRFSTLFKAKTCKQLKTEGKTQYYMQIATRNRPANATAYAVLKYDTTLCKVKNAPVLSTKVAPATPPFALPEVQLGWLDYKLQPQAPDNDFPTLNQVTRRVTITVQQIVNGMITWKQNGKSWTEDYTPVPYLITLYEDSEQYLPDYSAALANNGLDPKTTAFPAELGEVLEIVIQNSGNSAAGALDVHPFHAHGAHYYDIGSGPGTYDVAANEKLLAGTTPVKRDTTMLYKYAANTTPGANAGWRAWRIRVADPGVWMIHCHILQHMIMGMQTAWVFGNATDILKVPYPMVQGYLTYGGDVYGNSTHWPKVVHFSEWASLDAGN